MKTYVVALVSFFENNVLQFKVTAENKYEAVKLAMIEFASSEDARLSEIDFQNSEDYPQDFKSLELAFGNWDMSMSIIEI